MHRTAVLALVLAAGAAHAQSFNIDFDSVTGTGSGVPSSTYGGPAASPGVWNSIYAGSPAVVPLSPLVGGPSTVTLTRATGGTFGQTNSPFTSGSCEKLVDDFEFSNSGTLSYTFNNLASGTYAVYVIGVDPGSVNNLSTISVDGSQSSSQTTQYIGGTMSNDAYHAGVTHSVHFKNVSDGHLTVNVSAGFLTRAVVGALQIVQLPSASTRTRLYVDKNAVGFNNGGTWTNAMTDLQEALDAASLGGGSHFEVWVANAFYYPGTTRDATFKIASGLKIYGGFAGTESLLSQRPNPFTNATYLSGGIGTSSTTDDSYTVVTLQNCDNTTEFDGFYIARGHNDGTGHGGGMVISGGFAPRIRNCDFTTNTATNGGGHIYSTSSYPDIINCVFYHGDASNGVGGAIEAAGPTGSLTVQNCKFLGNTATGEGGAVYTSSLFSDFTNCLFSGNSTDFQAGAIRAAGSTGTMTLRNCTLSKNSTLGTCGGLYTSGGNDVVLYNNIIWGNTGSTPATTVDQGAYASTASGSSITASYNTWQGLSADPLFVNAAGPDGIPGNFDDDCHLRQGSPAIDFGDSAQLPNDIDDLDHNGILVEPMPVDLDGLTRRVDIPSAANFGLGAPTIDRGCYEFQLAEWCYANCDNSTTSPVLNVLDFSCYLNKFAAGDTYANCDNSTTPPVLNVLDFSCFLNKFAAGCP